MQDYQGSVLGGDLFNQLVINNPHFILITDVDHKVGYSLVVDDGENTKELTYTSGGTAWGGIPFFEEDNVIDQIKIYNMPTYYRTVTVPEVDTQVHIEENSYNSSRLILGPATPLEDLPLWLNEAFCNRALTKDIKLSAFIKNCSEDIFFNLVQVRPHLIAWVANKRSKKICMSAVSRKGYLLKFIESKDQDLEICTTAVANDHNALKYATYQTEEWCLDAVSKDGLLLEHVQNKSYQICLTAIKHESNAIKYVPDEHHTPELCTITMMQNISNIKYCKSQPKSVVLKMVKMYDGLMLEHVTNQDMEICQSAVFNNINAFKFAKYQTEEMCLRVVSRNGNFLAYVIEQTDAICKAAVDNNIEAFQYVTDAKEGLYIQAVSSDGCLIEHIDPEKLTVPICLAAVKNIGKAIKFVPKELQTKEMCVLAIDSHYYNLRYCKYQTYEQATFAIMSDGRMLDHVNKELIDQEMCDKAVNDHILAIHYIPPEFQTEELCLNIVKMQGNLLKLIANPTEEICLAAICKDNSAYLDIENPSEEASIAYVVDNGYNLRNIKPENQTENVVLIAVTQNVLAIEYAEVQSEEICIAACSTNINVLKHCKIRTPKLLLQVCQKNGIALGDIDVEEQTEELCLAAVKEWGSSLKFVKNKTYNLCLEAVTQQGIALEFVPEEHRTEEICKLAVYKSPYSLTYIKNPSNNIIKSCLKGSAWSVHNLSHEQKTTENLLTSVAFHPTSMTYIKYPDKEFYLMAFLVNPNIYKNTYTLDKNCINYVKKHRYIDYLNKELGFLDNLDKDKSQSTKTTVETEDPDQKIFDYSNVNMFDNIYEDNVYNNNNSNILYNEDNDIDTDNEKEDGWDSDDTGYKFNKYEYNNNPLYRTYPKPKSRVNNYKADTDPFSYLN